MTAQLSPEQVRSLLAGQSSLPAEQESTTAGGPKRVYRVTWDRCAVCKERLQGLSGVRAPGALARIMYVCEWCRKELGTEEESLANGTVESQESPEDELRHNEEQVGRVPPDDMEDGGQRAFSFAGLLPDSEGGEARIPADA